MNNEPDIVFARGGFPDVQTTLEDYPSKAIPGEFVCGWYGTSINDERGSFCIVSSNGELADRVGSYLRISYLTNHVSLYCVESHDILYDLAITRRAYWELAALWTPNLSVRVADVLDG